MWFKEGDESFRVQRILVVIFICRSSFSRLRSSETSHTKSNPSLSLIVPISRLKISRLALVCTTAFHVSLEFTQPFLKLTSQIVREKAPYLITYTFSSRATIIFTTSQSVKKKHM